jgi:DNA-binding MarR family transcriptional regulator
VTEEELRQLTELLQLQVARLHRTFLRLSPPMGVRLTANEVFVLWYLEARGDAKISDLARAARLSSAAMTQTCDTLEAHGLLERRRSNTDRRVVYAALTDSGRHTIAQIRESRTQRLLGVFRKLGIEDLRTLTRITGRIVQILEQQDL